MLKCKQCGEYSLSEKCKCGGEAVIPIPPKYSPEDKYAKYRQKAKEQDRKDKGLI